MLECLPEWEEDENLGAGVEEWKGRGRKKVWEKKGESLSPYKGSEYRMPPHSP